MNTVSKEVIAEMLAAAEASPRRRAHRNFHASLDEPVHRLLMGAMPDTLFPLHRHRDKFELLVIVHGEAEAIVTDDGGNVIRRFAMSPGGECCALEHEPGVWHTVKVIKPSVFLEVKPGPYVPVSPDDTLNVNVE